MAQLNDVVARITWWGPQIRLSGGTCVHVHKKHLRLIYELDTSPCCLAEHGTFDGNSAVVGPQLLDGPDRTPQVCFS